MQKKVVKYRPFFCAVAVSCASACLIAPGLAVAGDCEPYWDAAVGEPGMAEPWVNALTVFDDGSGGGPAVYAGGGFISAGGTTVNRIAKWDGESWSPLGSGVDGIVRVLTVFDDGAGPALYAGGNFDTAGGVAANRIARWDGESWSALGSGVSGGNVLALTVFDDGSGPALYAGGSFTTAGGVAANRIAKWDGSSWSAVGSGMDGLIWTLTAFDDGSGPALYAGGNFDTADGVAANRIARWDGELWSPLGIGMSGGGSVLAITGFDDGSGGGPAVYAGGTFTTAGGVTVNQIAKWDGSSWSALGTGMSGSDIWPTVHALKVFDDGSGDGPALYAGGLFTSAGDETVNRIAKWDGSSWSSLGSGMVGGDFPAVLALTVFDDGSGDGLALYAGGEFTSADGIPANHIAAWQGCADPGDPGIPGDLNGDGSVGVADLLILLSEWGPCDDCGDCPADLTGDCNVGVADLLVLLANWG